MGERDFVKDLKYTPPGDTKPEIKYHMNTT